MRNPVRKFMGVVLMGVLGALFAFSMVAANAQTNGSTGTDGVPPAPPGDCTILSVTPNPVPGFPTQVTITGTAPTTDNTTVVLYANGSPAAPNGAGDIVSQAVTTGNFTLKYTVTAATDISVNFTYGNQNAYTAGCATPGGEVVIRVDVSPTSATKPPAASLAFTGSSDTPSYVLIGLAAVVVGAVLVVAARRRSKVA